MNYLAHLFLADSDRLSLLGNLMGDFVKGRIDNTYPDVITNGLILHRQIDKFTDNHTVFKESRQRISGELARFSGVLVDIFYDHFLAVNWPRFSSVPFEHQTDQWIELLEGDMGFPLPEKLVFVLDAIKRDKMLHLYQTTDGVEFVLQRLSNRIRFDNNISDGIHDLLKNYHELDDDFNRFFPELIAYTESIKR